MFFSLLHFLCRMMIDQTQAIGDPLNGATDFSPSTAQLDDEKKDAAQKTSADACPSSAQVPNSQSAFDMQIEALSLPGYSVEQDGVFTVVRRNGTSGRSGTFPARIARYISLSLLSYPLISGFCRWLLSSKLWLPLLVQFTIESVSLAPYRMIILLVNKTISSLAPAARLWATSKLLRIVSLTLLTRRPCVG